MNLRLKGLARTPPSPGNQHHLGCKGSAMMSFAGSALVAISSPMLQLTTRVHTFYTRTAISAWNQNSSSCSYSPAPVPHKPKLLLPKCCCYAATIPRRPQFWVPTAAATVAALAANHTISLSSSCCCCLSCPQPLETVSSTAAACTWVPFHDMLRETTAQPSGPCSTQA